MEQKFMKHSLCQYVNLSQHYNAKSFSSNKYLKKLHSSDEIVQKVIGIYMDRELNTKRSARTLS